MPVQRGGDAGRLGHEGDAEPTLRLVGLEEVLEERAHRPRAASGARLTHHDARGALVDGHAVPLYFHPNCLRTNIANVLLVTGTGKTRRYDATARRAAADRTRRRVLSAAHHLFTTQGYAETSVAQVARRARVSVDTVYASVGRKPQLLLAVHDMALAGGPEPVPAEQRDYVRAVREAPTARAKIETYAGRASVTSSRRRRR